MYYQLVDVKLRPIQIGDLVRPVKAVVGNPKKCLGIIIVEKSHLVNVFWFCWNSISNKIGYNWSPVNLNLDI